MKIINTKIFSFADEPKVLALLFWATLCIALMVYAITKQQILPEYFFFDQKTILNFIQWGSHFEIGDSYASTAAFFSFLGADKNALVFTIFSTTIIIWQYFYCLNKAYAQNLTITDIILFTFLAVLSVTYITILSKEFVVSLVLLPFIYCSRHGAKGILLWCVIAIAYAAFFRTYWFIMIPMFLGLYWIFKNTSNPIILILTTPAALLLLSIVFSVFLGVDLDNFRSTVNDVRIDGGDNNARTMILPWISGGGPILSWINSCITWITLMLPAPLLILLSPYYLIIATLIAVLFYKSWQAFFTILAQKNQSDLSACSALIISFTAIQSIFEPDYGSYVKHLAPFFPLFLYIIFKSRLIAQKKQHTPSFSASSAS